MRKVCPEHGSRDVMVEPSLRFWLESEARPKIEVYDHMILDVTMRCNLSCRYCYMPIDNLSKDPSIPDLIGQVLETPYHVIMAGGEPTVRDDLPDVIRAVRKAGRRVCMLTNGLRLEDENYVDSLIEAGLVQNGVLEASTSLNKPGPAAYRAKFVAMQNVLNRGIKISELMFTIDKEDDIEESVQMMRTMRDVATRFRLRGPFNVWAESKAKVKFYVSDLYHALRRMAARNNWDFHLAEGADNSIYHTTVVIDGLLVRLIACPDKWTCDLSLMQCGPYYKGLDGRYRNFLHSMILNEGPHE